MKVELVINCNCGETQHIDYENLNLIGTYKQGKISVTVDYDFMAIYCECGESYAL